MRKNVIALILLLPMLFVLIVFSSVKTASLGVPISANGIEILEKPENDVYRIDLATYENNYSVKARVTPESASNRDYLYKIEEGDAVSIDEDGVIRAEKTGEVRISVVSKDGGFEDSVRVLVYSTKPYDFSFSLKALGETEEIALTPSEDGYAATLPTGRYAYAIKTLPEGSFVSPTVAVESGFADIDRVSGSVLFPFSGETRLKLSLEGQKGGKAMTIERKVTLTLEKPKTGSGFVINGGNSVLVLDKDSEEATFYVEGKKPQIEENKYISESEVEELAEERYRVKVHFAEKAQDFSLGVLGENGRREEVSFSFEEFDFALRSELPVQLSGAASVLLNTPISFYAMPSVATSGITYEWKAPNGLKIEPDEDGSECRLTATELGTFTLEVRAFKRGVPLDLFEKRLTITAVRQVSAVQFALKTDLGLAKSLVLAGEKFEGGNMTGNTYDLPLICFDGTGALTEGDMELASSDENIAKIEDGKLIPVGTGEVAITASWRGNDSFGTNIGAKITLFVVGDGVLCKNSPELYAAASEGRKIVLGRDILLGTDEDGEPLPVSEREKLLGSMRSTYNTEYYKNRGEEAVLKFALELKNDVYGNGYSLNAELLSAAKDGAGQPLFFRGPLDFVRFGQVASVAAQDNICFLVRTDGIKLHNLTLLGCSDGVLAGEGGYDLSALNTVGTTLEVNSSIEIENCRIRNGRTIMRAYGGNRSGEGYFTENLSEFLNRAEKERINVKVEGSILSQGREFLLKIGANGALRAGAEVVAPDFNDPNGNPYPFQTNGLAADEDFYRRYVFTDVVLKDSVLETSGLFTIGVESNFSGDLLQLGGEPSALEFEGWRGTGGTSFASVLRLEGDVRLYDWKALSLIDSSTLVETEIPELKLDVAAMLEFVCGRYPEKYGEIFDSGYVHGGIAFYGGGKNYAQLSTEGLESNRADFGEYFINISVLNDAEGSAGYLGRILPSAAGEQDFRFYLYGKSGENSRKKQLEEAERGEKYTGIKAIRPI